MSSTKYSKDKNRKNNYPGKRRTAVIDEDQYSDYDKNKVEFICSNCHVGPMARLRDSSGENVTLYCRQCSASYDQDDLTVQHRSRLSAPRDMEPEPAVAIIDNDYAEMIGLNKPKKLEWGLKALAERGLAIKDVREENIRHRRNWHPGWSEEDQSQ